MLADFDAFLLVTSTSVNKVRHFRLLFSPFAASPAMASPPFASLYPERRGDLSRVDHDSFTNLQRHACEKLVVRNVQNQPLIRLLIRALDSHNCDFDLERHVACDVCVDGTEQAVHMGGYDTELNQIFVCCNNVKNQGQIHRVVASGLLEMFDHCVHKVDVRNADHLACLEVRKANLTNCEMGSNFVRWSNPRRFHLDGEHANCVKLKAVERLVDFHGVDEDKAIEAVGKVFRKCYKDLEPIGRRALDTKDLLRAHQERHLYGYS